jgi:elongator complex protein 1
MDSDGSQMTWPANSSSSQYLRCRPAATVRVWDRQGCVLPHCGDAAADEATGLRPVAAWQPNGRNIYCSRNCQGALSVGIFERNGLGHGSFDIPTANSASLCALAWNCASDVLAAVIKPSVRPCSHAKYCERRCLLLLVSPCIQRYLRESVLLCTVPIVEHVQVQDGSGDSGARLQLWQRRNWHWYLVHERSWPRSTTHVFPLWSASRPHALHVLTSDGILESLLFSSATWVSPRGTAAVIDASQLLVTPLQHAVVPPPMAAARIACGAAVTAVAWGNLQGCETLAAVTTDGDIAVSVAVESDLWEETAEEAAAARGAAASAAQHLLPPLQVRAREHISKGCTGVTAILAASAQHSSNVNNGILTEALCRQGHYPSTLSWLLRKT